MSKEGKKPKGKPAVVMDAKFIKPSGFIPNSEFTYCLVQMNTTDAKKLKDLQPIVIIVEQ